jgi:hypothetical protein
VRPDPHRHHHGAWVAALQRVPLRRERAAAGLVADRHVGEVEADATEERLGGGGGPAVPHGDLQRHGRHVRPRVADGEHLVPLRANRAGDVAAGAGPHGVRAHLDLHVRCPLTGPDAAHADDADEEVAHGFHQVVRRWPHGFHRLALGREPPGDDAGRGGVAVRGDHAARVRACHADALRARRHPVLHLGRVLVAAALRLRCGLRFRMRLRRPVRTVHRRGSWPVHLPVRSVRTVQRLHWPVRAVHRRWHHGPVHRLHWPVRAVHRRWHHGPVHRRRVHVRFLHVVHRRLPRLLLHLNGSLGGRGHLGELPRLLRRDLRRRRVVVLLLRRLLLGRRRRAPDRLVVVVNLEAHLATDPAEQAALLEREVDDAFLAAARELGPVDAHAAEEVVLAAAARRVEPAVVVERDVQRLGVHAGGVRHSELQPLVPLRVEVPRHGAHVLPLPVEVHHRVRARRAQPVLGHQVPRVHHLHSQPPHHRRWLRRWATATVRHGRKRNRDEAEREVGASCRKSRGEGDGEWNRVPNDGSTWVV